MEKRDTKGQQMTLGTIITVVLGILVLVFLIYGFSTGWGNLWDRITNFGGGESNLDTIAQSCAVACTTKSQADFCTRKRTVNFGEEVTLTAEVKDAEGKVTTEAETTNSVTATCDNLAGNTYQDRANNSALNLREYINVDSCPSLC